MRKLLYSNGSPFARRVRIVLAEMEIPFESDINDELRPIGEIRPYNPALQVPVFLDGERRLFDSNLILQYLYATYPSIATSGGLPPLSPSITRPDRHWDDMLTLATIEALADSLVNVRLMEGADERTVPFLVRQRVRMTSCLDWLEARCSKEGFWQGTFSVMDINLMCPLLYGEKRKTFDFRTGAWPRVSAMIDGWQSRASVRGTPVNDWPLPGHAS